jgi:hypothetical protein
LRFLFVFVFLVHFFFGISGKRADDTTLTLPPLPYTAESVTQWETRSSLRATWVRRLSKPTLTGHSLPLPFAPPVGCIFQLQNDVHPLTVQIHTTEFIDNEVLKPFTDPSESSLWQGWVEIAKGKKYVSALYQYLFLGGVTFLERWHEVI